MSALVVAPVKPYPPVVLPDGTWRFHGIVKRVKDGDTAVVVLIKDTGFGQWQGEERAIRVMGIDSDETKTTSGKAEAAYAVAKWTGRPVWVVTVKPDKWGDRVDGTITDAETGVEWAADMLATHNADPYDGGKRTSA